MHAVLGKFAISCFPDILLNVTTFPLSTYLMKNTFYPTIRDTGGIALDSRQWWGKADWNIWSGAAVSALGSTGTMDMMINDIWAFGMNSAPCSDRWVVRDDGPKSVGSEIALRARPTVGGHFALLALKGARYLKWRVFDGVVGVFAAWEMIEKDLKSMNK